MPRRSQENYFDDFWLDLVKNDARDQEETQGIGVWVKKVSIFRE